MGIAKLVLRRPACHRLQSDRDITILGHRLDVFALELCTHLSFYKYTPGGQIVLSTVNKTAADYFEVGKEYYVDFSAAE